MIEIHGRREENGDLLVVVVVVVGDEMRVQAMLR